MARVFRSRRTMSAVSEINLTNMIDLGFVLLIIFMISTPLIERQSSMDVNLPVAPNQPSREPAEQFLDITVNRSNQIQADGRIVSISELQSILASESRRSRPRVVNVRADLALQYQQVVTILDLVKGAGLSRISLETRPQ
jgi:biopolymer transport protein ExbD